MAVKKSTNLSIEFLERAKKVMPGGVTANIKFFSPHPIVMNKGSGAYLKDVDGNEYIDYLLSYGSLMLGHGHPEIKKSIYSQINESGTWLFGTPHELEVTFGEQIKKYYPSIDLLRYTNSGTEATLLALRFAATYTGKFKIAKFEGHYHGGYDQVLLSVDPSIEEAGSPVSPLSVPSSKGINPYQQQQTVILPFNTNNAFEILERHRNEIGAVVLEPIQGGFIPAKREFIKELRRVTKELDMVLIFDEVKTGFRVGLGGAQSLYGIKPDLTALGKVIGGGFPVGVVGGKKEILMESAPVRGNSNNTLTSKDVLFHSGTYNGHPMILAAGLATIKVLEKELDSVLMRTETLKEQLETLFYSKGIAMKAVGIGSMFNIVLTDEEILNYRDYQRSDFKMRKEIDSYLLKEGVYSKPLNRYSLSTSHGEKEIEKTVAAFEKVLLNL
ncbi:aspartate aminotransferase family protein [Oceanobacillus damuensis]|uniref:aspartate aminotransferase family protein n=1 Tax=Oceanobacillus damuensis TaxID=937928 RepID=UPI000A6EBAC1|nr:aspartate aminotransferase family protein [Oceanobacillus damuensis]